MDIRLIDKEIDIAGAAVYTARVASGIRYLKMRQWCVDQGEDVREKDHFYTYAEYIVKELAAGTAEREIKTTCVLSFVENEKAHAWQVIATFENGQGLDAIKRRGELIESLKGSARGTVAFLIRKTEDGDRFDALISNGFGRVFSSHKANFLWAEKPSVRKCMMALVVSEFNHCNELVGRELDRQCNLDTVKRLGMKAGEVFDGYSEGPLKAKKIKVLEVNADGHVKFEICAPGVREKGRIKKEVEARFLKVSKCKKSEKLTENVE